MQAAPTRWGSYQEDASIGPAPHRKALPLQEVQMKFGLFYELSVPQPFTRDAEHKVIHDALAQVKLADDLGFEHVWIVEHHFLEELSASSAPDLFLTACAMQTSQIRL